MKRLTIILLVGLMATAAFGEGLAGGGRAIEERTVCARAIVRLSVCNMRRSGDYDAEMISQALLGTPVKVFSTGRWNEIETPDGYRGWVHEEAIALLDERGLSAWESAEKLIVTAMTGLVHEDPAEDSPTISDIVGGDRLEYLGSRGGWLRAGFPDGRVGYVRRTDAVRESLWRRTLRQDGDAIVETALRFLGFPYIWGGMSPKGADCSGFVRAVLWMHDIVIPRDAGPQSEYCERLDLSQLQKGDLIFFGRLDPDGNMTQRVNHVGIYIGDGRYIHSLGLVKIASLRKEDELFDPITSGRALFGGRYL